jgi:hypothetical protein
MVGQLGHRARGALGKEIGGHGEIANVEQRPRPLLAAGGSYKLNRNVLGVTRSTVRRTLKGPKLEVVNQVIITFERLAAIRERSRGRPSKWPKEARSTLNAAGRANGKSRRYAKF